jgi:hypothetical protein
LEGNVLKDWVGAGTTGRLEAGGRRLLERVTEHVRAWTTFQVRQSKNVTEFICNSILLTVLFCRHSEGVDLAECEQWERRAERTGSC